VVADFGLNMSVLACGVTFNLAKTLPRRRLIGLGIVKRLCSSHSVLDSRVEKHPEVPLCLDFHKNFDPDLQRKVVSSMVVFDDFVSKEEEESIFAEVQPYMKRLRYEFDHWDDVSILHTTIKCFANCITTFRPSTGTEKLRS